MILTTAVFNRPGVQEALVQIFRDYITDGGLGLDQCDFCEITDPEIFEKTLNEEIAKAANVYVWSIDGGFEKLKNCKSGDVIEILSRAKRSVPSHIMIEHIQSDQEPTYEVNNTYPLPEAVYRKIFDAIVR